MLREVVPQRQRFNFGSTGQCVCMFHSPLALVLRGEGVEVGGNRVVSHKNAHFHIGFNHFVIFNHDAQLRPLNPGPSSPEYRGEGGKKVKPLYFALCVRISTRSGLYAGNLHGLTGLSNLNHPNERQQGLKIQILGSKIGTRV
ncbi:MAG: hypothetical protein JWM11_8112 [Planctomycetaceae bacterium]|nr:hypothetical protein [Planctomycetaceae bacterium]